MRILAYMVARNEEHRYIDSCLAWAMPWLDGLALYDDRSTDYTVDLGIRHGARVAVRPETVPSFLEHEGQFRQAAWAWFEHALLPEDGDWVLALDSDEFLVDDDRDPKPALMSLAKKAEEAGCLSVRLPVPEVFKATIDDDMLLEPQVRVDGFWGKILGTRFFKWLPGGEFSGKAMGSGAEPLYVPKGRVFVSPGGTWLMHYGYAHPDDVQEKFKRYSTLLDHGHSNTHVQSIPQEPVLEKWTGPQAMVWRGAAPYCEIDGCHRPATNGELCQGHIGEGDKDD